MGSYFRTEGPSPRCTKALDKSFCFGTTHRTGPKPPAPPRYGVRIERVRIPMKDGVGLAASLFIPTGGKPAEKFPALLEYLPYRKDDGTIERDYPLHTYFAHRGYVTAR